MLHISCNSKLKGKSGYMRSACGIKSDGYVFGKDSYIVDVGTFINSSHRNKRCKKCEKKLHNMSFEKIRIGNIYQLLTVEDEYFLLIQSDNSFKGRSIVPLCQLVCINNGNRWKPPVEVKDYDSITMKEFGDIIGNGLFKYVGRFDNEFIKRLIIKL